MLLDVIYSSYYLGYFLDVFKGPKARVVKGLIVIRLGLVWIIIIFKKALPNAGGIDKRDTSFASHNYGLHDVYWENNCLGRAMKKRVFGRVFGLRHFLGSRLAF
jgi:hypothetical protein